MTLCAAVRALAAQCRDAVAFCRTPHAGADRLWAETSRRDGADRLAEQEAEREVAEPWATDWAELYAKADAAGKAYAAAKVDYDLTFSAAKPTVGCPNCGCQLTMTYTQHLLPPFTVCDYPHEDILPRQPAYPPFNPSNHESSSVDGEAATVAGPPTEDSPVASVSADLDATGPPTCGSERHHRPAIRVRCSRPTGHDGMHGHADIFWRDKDPEK